MIVKALLFIGCMISMGAGAHTALSIYRLSKDGELLLESVSGVVWLDATTPRGRK